MLTNYGFRCCDSNLARCLDSKDTLHIALTV